MINFKGNSQPSLGIEIELLLIDPITKDLLPQSVQILDFFQKAGVESFKHELSQAQIEFNSDPAAGIVDLKKGAQKKIKELVEVAAKNGAHLISAGSHPFHKRHHEIYVHNERYNQIVEKFQSVVKKLTISGVHIHVGVDSGNKCVALMSKFKEFIPHFLALSGSSPFWEGSDTGLDSYRTVLFACMPAAGTPHHFTTWQDFAKFYERLKAGRALDSIRDIYWDIRPHVDFGTIEFRMCDAISTLSEAFSLVALAQCLVVWFSQKYDAGETLYTDDLVWRIWAAKENKWRAARYGLEAELVPCDEGRKIMPLKEEITKIVEVLMPTAKKLKCEKELANIKNMLDIGNSASRQRAIYKETGSLEEVVGHLIKEFETDTPVVV